MSKTPTEIEETVPGVAELLPGFGNEGAEPLGDGAGVHGGLEGAEHQVQGSDVVLGLLGDLVFQTTESALVQNGRHTCEEPEERKLKFLFDM